MLNKIDFTEVVKKGNTPLYITPRHSGELIKYSQAIFKGMLAMYNEIGSSQKYPKLYDLRNLDYWNSLKVSGTMYDIQIYIDGAKIYCEATKMVYRPSYVNCPEEEWYYQTDHGISMVLWVCELNSESCSYTKSVIKSELDMYRVKFKYDFNNPLSLINGDSMENGLVSADYVKEDKPFTW